MNGRSLAATDTQITALLVAIDALETRLREKHYMNIPELTSLGCCLLEADWSRHLHELRVFVADNNIVS